MVRGKLEFFPLLARRENAHLFGGNQCEPGFHRVRITHDTVLDVADAQKAEDRAIHGFHGGNIVSAVSSSIPSFYLPTNSLCICSVLRTIYIYRTFYDTYDMTWASQPAWLWLSLETELAVVCASAPALKVFFKKAFQMTTSKSRSSSSKDKSNSTGRAPSRSSMHKLDQWDISVDTEHSGGLSDVEFTTYDYGKSADFGSAAGVEYDRYGQRITQESEKVAYDRYGQRIGPPSTPWSRSGPLSAPPSRRGTPSAPPSRSGPPSAPPSRSGPPQIPLTFFDEPNEIGVTFLEEPDVTDGVFYTTVSDSRYHHAY